MRKFKERFEIKLRAYNAALGPTNQVSDERAAVVFLDNLHRTPYEQFYANEINIINADTTKVPKSVGDIYQKAKAYVVIATTTKPNQTKRQPCILCNNSRFLSKIQQKEESSGEQQQQQESCQQSTEQTNQHWSTCF